MLLDTTDGHEVVWTNGPAQEQWAPDIYSWIPGESGPTAIFIDQHRNAQINTLVVHSGMYVFEERLYNDDATLAGWRLWFISGRGAGPVLLDGNAADPEDLPFPAIEATLTDREVIWQATHRVNGEDRWSLRRYDLRTAATTTLIEAPLQQVEYWFPSADEAGRLVYATMEYGPDHLAATAAYHVYMADLSADPIKPRRLDKAGIATEPVLADDGDTVVWKIVGQGESVGTWGQLARYSISRDDVEPIWVFGQANLTYLSAGNRFLVGWEPDSTNLVVYDLETGETVSIERHEATSPIHLVRAVVSEDMLVYIRADSSLPAGKHKFLCYAKLPPPIHAQAS